MSSPSHSIRRSALACALLLLACADPAAESANAGVAGTADQGPNAGSPPATVPGDARATDTAPGTAGSSAGSPGSGGRGKDGAVPGSDAGLPDRPMTDDSAGTGAESGGENLGCTRELLAATVDAYFAALAADDAAALPLADGVKFTENGELLQLGDGLWQAAGAVTYAHSALDVERCTSVTEAVVPEGGVDVPVALRLTLADQAIVEIETIVARPGDYVIFGSAFESDPAAIIASASLGWEDPVPAAQRSSREQIEGWITRYFESFPNGGCDLAEDCLRLENGGGSFSCSLGASCSEGSAGGGLGGPMDARLVVVDVVTGVAAGFTMFMGHTDMHMIMMRGGEIHAVHATLSAADSSGWQ